MMKREVDENGLVADFFTESSMQPRKAILMVGGSEGGKSWSRVRTPIEILVQRGYSVLSLAYFKARGLPDTLQEIPLEYFERAFDWLSAQAGIAPDAFALLGGSKGAEAALLLGSKYPSVKAVIAFSPSSHVWQGIPGDRFALVDDVRSSWTWEGEGLPFLPYPAHIHRRDLLMMRLRKMHEEALRDEAKAQNAAIPVENIQGAIMLISGTGDRLWPAAEMGERMMTRLTVNGFKYPHEHLVLDGGHNGILMNRECWRRIFIFLEENFA